MGDIGCGYVSGSGNYTSIQIPLYLDSTVSGGNIVSLQNLSLYRHDGTKLTQANIDTSYLVITKNDFGHKLELKFTSTISPVSTLVVFTFDSMVINYT